MHNTMLLPGALLLLCFLHISVIDAKCCNPDVGGDCGDNSPGTPCCGYNNCNGFCCACEGVGIIRQEVETGGSIITSVITAPVGVTWTCRDDHVTKHPPKVREAVVDTVFVSGTQAAATPIVTTAPRTRGRLTRWDGDCDGTLKTVSGGSGRVTLEQYRSFFNVTDEQSDRYKAVDAMFRARDSDRNGVLTKDELEEMLSYDDIKAFE